MMENAFLNADTMVIKREQMSGKTSPLEFLAQASLDFGSQGNRSKWVTTASEGRERITVVPGHVGMSIRLHKGNGKLQHSLESSKPMSKKCRNRECNNLGGQAGKPRSIYCSKRCQSREQNLRQGRIKNVRSPTQNSSPDQTSNGARNHGDMSNNSSKHNSPRSSPSPLSMTHNTSSSPLPMPSSSPCPSPISYVSNSPQINPSINSANIPPHSIPLSSTTSPSPSPLMMLAPNSISTLNHSSLGNSSSNLLSSSPFTSSSSSSSSMMPISASPLLHTLSPSPLNLRLGMTPSPLTLSLSPLPAHFTAPTPPPGTFSPIPMSSSIPAQNTSIFLPKPTPQPTQLNSVSNQSMSGPVKTSSVNLSTRSFTAPETPSQKKVVGNANQTSLVSSEHDNLTLAPIRNP